MSTTINKTVSLQMARILLEASVGNKVYDEVYQILNTAVDSHNCYTDSNIQLVFTYIQYKWYKEVVSELAALVDEM